MFICFVNTNKHSIFEPELLLIAFRILSFRERDLVQKIASTPRETVGAFLWVKTLE